MFVSWQGAFGVCLLAPPGWPYHQISPNGFGMDFLPHDMRYVSKLAYPYHPIVHVAFESSSGVVLSFFLSCLLFLSSFSIGLRSPAPRVIFHLLYATLAHVSSLSLSHAMAWIYPPDFDVLKTMALRHMFPSPPALLNSSIRVWRSDRGAYCTESHGHDLGCNQIQSLDRVHNLPLHEWPDKALLDVLHNLWDTKEICQITSLGTSVFTIPALAKVTAELAQRPGIFHNQMLAAQHHQRYVADRRQRGDFDEDEGDLDDSVSGQHPDLLRWPRPSLEPASYIDHRSSTILECPTCTSDIVLMVSTVSFLSLALQVHDRAQSTPATCSSTDPAPTDGPSNLCCPICSTLFRLSLIPTPPAPVSGTRSVPLTSSLSHVRQSS